MDKRLRYAVDFVKYTAEDFTHVWEDRPNVLIWCTIVGIFLYWV